MSVSIITTPCFLLLIFLIFISTTTIPTLAGDPDILTDFFVPPSLDPATLTRSYFTFTNLRQLRKSNLTGRTTPIVTKVTKKEFPVLEGQSVSTAIIMYPPNTINPPHIHPRGAELLLLLDGTLKVGFVDSKGKLFVQTLVSPDLFIFPKGLVHFQANEDGVDPAIAVAMFGTASPGTVVVGEGVFGSGIDEGILAAAFKTDVGTVDKIVQGFGK